MVDYLSTWLCLLIYYRVIILFQVYVQYMKFARRAEGIKSARTVFKRAREDPRCAIYVFNIM